MCQLNSGALTYVNPCSRNHSAIDLTICNPTIYRYYTWTVHDDTCGSDHFPILIKSTEHSSVKIPRWKLDNANWEIFKETRKNKLTHKETNHNIVEHFTKTLTEIVKNCIPRNSAPNKRNRPWFGNECRKTIILRRYGPTISNLIELRPARWERQWKKNAGKDMLATWIHPLNR